MIRVIISASVVYLALIIMLRIGGKRTLSKWNAFDFIVTIAMGSIIASIILNKDVTVVEGLLASGVLILLQASITWLSVRIGWIEGAVKAQPTLLYANENFLRDNMRTQRVTRSEMLAAIRASGIGHLSFVDAVVLETDGSFSVVESIYTRAGMADALEDVDGYKDDYLNEGSVDAAHSER